MHRPTALRKFVGILITAVALTGLATGCQFRTPAPVTPLTDDSGQGVPKTFFFKNGQYSATVESRQVFLAGWAPIDVSGIAGESSQLIGVPDGGHLNIEWEVTEKALIGYKVNPSYEGTARHSQAFIEIPITKQYYYEPEKDTYMRDTNRYIKNDQRDAFQYRPFMDLDFQNIKIDSGEFRIFDSFAGDVASAVTGSSVTVLKVTDIQWDQAHKYLAFTVLAKDSAFPEYGQASFRFNFMAFDTDPTFKKTPVNASTARVINVLHEIGKKVNGVDNPERYAGHWKLPVTFYTYGVPDEDSMQVLREVVAGWNDAFKQADIHAYDAKGNEVPALALNETPLKYPFDLRYPVFHWISDRRGSQLGAPLGIGEAAADVENGQFLFGSVNIWAGILDEYMNRYIATGDVSDAADAMGQSTSVNLRSLVDDQDQFHLKGFAYKGMQISDFLRSDAATAKLKQTISKVVNAQNRQLSLKAMLEMAKKDPSLLEKYDFSKLQNDGGDLDMYADIASAHLDEDLQSFDAQPVGPIPDHLGTLQKLFPELTQNPADNMCTQNLAAGASFQCVMRAQKAGFNSATDAIQALSDRLSRHSADYDRTFADFLGHMGGIDPGSVGDEKATVHAVLKLLTMHELGHVLGLGHNFKGNVMPEHGSVPEPVYQQLKQVYLAHKKDPEHNRELWTTVMDYGGGTSYARLKKEDVKAGPYDIMMLKYLYQGKYPVVNPKDPNDYKYVDVDGDLGVITDTTVIDGKTYKTAFLPACNDIDASLNLDPFCTRWDRGANALEIVTNRFNDMKARLPALLNAFSGSKGGDPYLHEAYLWGTSFDDFSQTRVFYDLMRAELDAPGLPYRDAFAHIRSDPQALYAFSQACLDPNTAPDGFKHDFAVLALRDPSKLGTPVNKLDPVDDFTQIHDLCAANEKALIEWGTLLTNKGSDYTTFDIFRRYFDQGIAGGDATGDGDFLGGYAWGTYQQIGLFPLRLATLYTVTTPQPVFVLGGLWPIPTFAGPQESYSYASLYPKEFSSIVSTTVTENMSFHDTQLETNTEMGTTLMYLNYFLERNRFYTKDTFNRFPTAYINNLADLTNFEFNISPIILTNVTDANRSQALVFKYKAEYVDLAKYDTIAIPWAYLLQDRSVVAKGIEKQLFLPITKFRYLADTWGYVWAFDLKYQDSDLDDGLKGNNAKLAIDALYQQQVNKCYAGDNGLGLSAFFTDSNPDFDGFTVQTGIAFKEDLQTTFEKSVKSAFDKYETNWIDPKTKKPYPVDATACDEAQKGIGLIVSAAALINGAWLPQAAPYMNY